jgi:hypothetical protein
MKSQTDLIVVIVAGVLTVFAALAMILMRRDPVALAAPTQVVLTPPQLPAGDVTFSTSLPGGSASSSGFGGPGGMGGFGGGMPGMPGGGGFNAKRALGGKGAGG